jgi:hypothetical protein
MKAVFWACVEQVGHFDKTVAGRSGPPDPGGKVVAIILLFGTILQDRVTPFF